MNADYQENMSNLSGSLTGQLLQKIGIAIANGKYFNGTYVLTEADIAEEFNASRSATREAVKMLTAKGILNSRPRQGIKILPRNQWNMFDRDVLRWILESSPSLEALCDFLQLRLAIEPESAALAAISGNPEKIAMLEKTLVRMKRAEQGLEDPLEADISFHTSLLQASDNPFFMQFSNFIETALRVSIRFTNRVKGVSSASYEDHENIYNAISGGNPIVARATSYSVQKEALDLVKKELQESDNTRIRA